MTKFILRTLEFFILILCLGRIDQLFAKSKNEIKKNEEIKEQHRHLQKKQSKFRPGEVIKTKFKSKRFKLSDKNLDFDLLSQVQSPQFAGQVLQSTTVDVRGHIVAIGHNLAGEISAGGLELFLLNQSVLKKVAALYSEDFELAMVKIIDDRTILGVGAARDLGAAAFVFSLFDGAINLVSQTLLPGHYATSIDFNRQTKKALISSGDDGGSFEIDFRDLAYPSLTKSYGADFILDSYFFEQSLLQLESSDQTQLIFSPSQQQERLMTKMCDAKVEAPARMILEKDKVASNACPGFFKVLGKHSPLFPFVELASLPILGRGNGLDSMKDFDSERSLFFLAQGDFGIEVALFEHQQNKLKSLGKLENGDNGSSNAVFARPSKDGVLLFVCAGSQGTRIYRVSHFDRPNPIQ